MGPNLKNCPICGRVFAFQGRDICSKCLEKEDGDYAIVRRYVRDHPGAGVTEVAEATEIDEEKILQFLRDGRLVTKSLGYNITCERCGKIIPSGKYCQTCLKVLEEQIKGIMPSARQVHEPETQPRGKGKDKMHIKESDF